MAAEYFEKFPSFIYDNTIATNIIARVKLKEDLKKALYQYYSYTIDSGNRPDNVADSYYKRANFSWLIFLANDIVNPLIEWHKDQITLENYIRTKYGSLDTASVRTAYYRVNWSSDPSKITQSQYDALTPARRRYWTRAFSTEQQDETYWKIEESQRDYSKSTRYERAKLNAYTETNRIVKLNYVETVDTDDVIVVGDIIQRYDSNNLVAQGEVAAKGAGYLTLKHVSESGTGFNAGNTAKVRDKENQLSISQRTVLSTSIPNDEFIYWEPISFYTLEVELNDARRLISLLDNRYATQAERELGNLLRQ